MKKYYLLFLLLGFIYLSNNIAAIAANAPFTSFPNETACEADDEFIFYRNGTGTRNTTCEGIRSYVNTANGTLDATGGPPIVEDTSSGFESDGSIAVPTFTDITNGDFLLSLAAVDYATAVQSTVTQSGFSNLEVDFGGSPVSYIRANPTGAGTGLKLLYKIADSESGDYSVTESGSYNTAAVMLRISGVKSWDPIDVSACSIGTDDTAVAPSIDVTIDDALVLTVYAWDQSKTIITPPSGFATAIHNDQSGVDLWVGYETQTISGASGTNNMVLSGAAPWIACTIALQEPNATSTPDSGGGGGGGATANEGPGPFSVLDDGSGNGIKYTSPANCSDVLSGLTDACEYHPTTSPSYSPGDIALDTYEHPLYFIRDPDYYRMCSPIYGAYTSSNTSGPARSEFRYLENVTSGTMAREFEFQVKVGDMPNNAKANIGQIHRVDFAPVFKLSYTYKTDGSGSYRSLVKATASSTDDTRNLLTNVAPGEYIRLRYIWNIAAETLDFYAAKSATPNPTLPGTPTQSYTGVQLDAPSGAYSKLGLYANNSGDGTDNDLLCVDIRADAEYP